MRKSDSIRTDGKGKKYLLTEVRIRDKGLSFARYFFGNVINQHEYIN